MKITMDQPFCDMSPVPTAVAETTPESTPMATLGASVVEPMDPETQRDIQTKLRLAEMALERGNYQSALHWNRAARQSLDAFKQSQIAA